VEDGGGEEGFGALSNFTLWWFAAPTVEFGDTIDTVLL
jgi:hypothetical protein